MATPNQSTTSADKVALYDKLIATHPKIERKGAAHPYTSLKLNGHTFTLWHPSSTLAIRLPEGKREEFLRYETTLFEAYGAGCESASQFATCVPPLPYPTIPGPFVSPVDAAC